MPARSALHTRYVLPLLAAACVTVFSACAADAPDAANQAVDTAAALPNLLGTWTGEYEFPYGDTVIKTSLDLVIERQEGSNLFGYETFVNGEGETIRYDLVGTANIDPVDGEVEVVMATTGFFFDIEVVSAERLSARFVRTDDKPTTFVVELRKKA